MEVETLSSLLGQRGITIKTKISRGAQKQVFLGEMKTPAGKIPVAVKVIDGSLLFSPGTLEALFSEAEALKNIKHPNVEALHEALATDKWLILVTEYIKGVGLYAFVDSYTTARQAKLPWEIALQITRQVAEGLAAIHAAGFVHRDISPANIMLASERKLSEMVKIIDLGLAKNLRNPAKDGISSVLAIGGTPPFAAPELRVDPSKVDFKADIFSLATLLFWLLTKSFPFGPISSDREYYAAVSRGGRLTVDSFRGDIPTPVLVVVRDLLYEGLSPHPQGRPTAREFADRLGEVLERHQTKIEQLFPSEVLIFLDNQPLPDDNEDDDLLHREAGTVKREIRTKEKRKRSGRHKRSAAFAGAAALAAALLLALAFLFVPHKGKKNLTGFAPVEIPLVQKAENKGAPPQGPKQSFKKPETPPQPVSRPKGRKEPALQGKTPVLGPRVKELIMYFPGVEIHFGPDGRITSSKPRDALDKRFVILIK